MIGYWNQGMRKWSPSVKMSSCTPPIRLKMMARWPPSTVKCKIKNKSNEILLGSTTSTYIKPESVTNLWTLLDWFHKQLRQRPQAASVQAPILWGSYRVVRPSRWVYFEPSSTVDWLSLIDLVTEVQLWHWCSEDWTSKAPKNEWRQHVWRFQFWKTGD